MLFGAVFGCAGKPSAVEEPPPARVKIETASAINLGEWTEILGTTQPLPDRLARVTALTEGRVVSVLGDGKKNRVAEGDSVQAGQVIVQLEDSVVKAKREKTAASMPELDEAMKQAQIAIKLAEVDVKRVSVGTLSNIVSPIEQEKFRLALLVNLA
jgi:multidrug efflux pump subunit AcrA (membrane-fusion protein)